MSETIKIKKVNEVYFQLEFDDFGTALELKEYFSFYAANYKFHPKFKAKIWNGKITMYDRANSLLPIGLLTKLLKFCKRFGYKHEFVFDTSELINDVSLETVKEHCYEVTKELKFDPYDYQVEAVHRAINNKRGIVLSPTGSGKSLIIYCLIRWILKEQTQIILVVPNISLVEQMYSDMKYDYKWEEIEHYVSKLHSETKPDFSLPVLITTWQSVQRKTHDFFEPYGALLVDEAHGEKSSVMQGISKKCTNCSYRIGLTGTLPTEDSDVFNIYGYLGGVIFKRMSKDLIDMGVLSNIQIMNLFLRYPADVVKKNKYRSYVEEVETIYNYHNRNTAFDFVFDHIKKGQNSLVLCHKIDHLKNIAKYLEDTLDDDYQICVIYGSVNAKDREEIRKMMDTEENIVLIGTYATCSTGLNIKRIHNVIFASSYKSKIKILQSIGRGLRLHESKDKMILWDLIDSLCWETRNGTTGKNHVYKHFEERSKFYEEQGFKTYKKILNI